ncbi:MAG TPA: hypothetical protein VFP91_18985 [Vicinamibacterales bacterium]|nr:hypothetical protein [Vicinamibacterales bacterium]
MLTIGIIGVVSGLAVLQIGAARQSILGDSGMRVVLAQLNVARELSISQRRTMQVQFGVPNALQIVRNDVPGGATLASAAVFEGRVEYMLVPGVPDTPDAFGRAQSIDFGAAAAILFNSDGTLVDERGRPINGTIFLAVRGGNDRSVRAITVLGATGRIRAYRWNGSTWVRA